MLNSTDEATPIQPAPGACIRQGARTVVATVLGVALAVTAACAQDPVDSAREVALEYATALEDGDVERAAELDPGIPSVDTSAGEVTPVDGLTPEAMVGATAISDVTVSEGNESEEGGAVGFRVTYRVDGEDYEASIDVVDDTAGGWRLNSSLARAYEIETSDGDFRPAGVFGLTIGDVEVTTSPHQPTYVALYPGTYRIKPDAGRLLAGSSSDRTVGHDVDHRTIVAGLEPTEALEAEVSDQMTAVLEDCLDTTESYVAGCGFYPDDVPFIEEPVQWSILAAPAVQEFTPVHARVTARVRAEYEGGWKVNGPRARQSEDIDLAGRGSMQFDSVDEVTVTAPSVGWAVEDGDR